MICNYKRCLSTVVIASSLFTAYLNDSPAQAIPNPRISWTLQTFSKKQKNFEVTVKYPVFAGSFASLQRLNSKVRKIAQRQYRDATKEHLHDRSRPQEPIGEFTATYEVDKVSRNVASLNCNIIDYTPDAATSSAEIQTFNYTLNSLRKLQLDDLFKNGVDYEEVLKVISMGKLFATTNDAAWSYRNCNYAIDHFAVGEDGLILFFTQDTPNEIVHVTIPIRQIRQLMDNSLANRLWTVRTPADSDGEQILKAESIKKQLAIIAIGTYSAMIDANPSNALAFRERGKWYKELGRAEVAAKDLEEANRLAPE
ncbi:MAG: hypothetical protein P4L53_00050 [Candidatus Obscuribacterales bacterium]|nr:hypothetical protein [Candidatus Obscuribacterales bacterium]